MQTRFLMQLCFAVSATLMFSVDAGKSQDNNITTQRQKFHDELVTMDLEIDIPPTFMIGANDVGYETSMQIDLPKMDGGGLDGAIFVVWVPQQGRTPEAYAKARADAEQKFSAIEKMAATYPERIEIAKRADDVDRIVKAGRHFAVLGMVNAYPLGTDLSWLPDLYARGLRNIALTHAGHNQFADSSRPRAPLNDPPEEYNGLSNLGRELVKEMNRLGIIVDVSQLSVPAVLETARLSKAPIIASHSGFKAKVNTDRNLTDEEMLAIKDSGGLVGVVAFSNYLRPSHPGQRKAFSKILEKYGTSNLATVTSRFSSDKVEEFKLDIIKYDREFPRANVSNLVESIEYAINLLGIDHVSISSDMEHGGGVTGWMNAGESFAVTEELLKRGYGETAIAKLWSQNFIRVWRTVEFLAQTQD